MTFLVIISGTVDHESRCKRGKDPVLNVYIFLD